MLSLHYSIKTHSCRPIHTYKGKGTLASHAKASHHVQVYTESKPPPLLPRERLTRNPIRVIVKNTKTSLDKASRLNLSKPQSIEHNLPVAEIGKVSKEDLERITKYTLEYLKPDDANDEDEEEEKAEEKEEDEEDEEDDKVPDNLNQRLERNRHGNYLQPTQPQNRSWSDRLPVRPQTTIGIRTSQGQHGGRRRR
jgi:phosphopantothenoylcysteine synthetase/decarboxylase